MIFLVQFRLNMHLLTKLHSPYGLVQFVVFEKIYLFFVILGYTRNHVITYTNSIIFFFLTHALVKLLTRVSHFSFHSDFYLFNRFEKV